MQQYVIELSKYFIIICMAVFTYEGFAVFRYKEETAKNGIYVRQGILLFFIQFFSFLIICIKSENIEYLFFYAIVQIILFSTIALARMIYPKVNRLLLNNMCMLLGTGFVILARLSFQKAIKQLVIVFLSLILAMFLPQMMCKLTFLKKLKWAYAGVGIAALSIVLILGEVTHGSKLSFSVMGITFQPSEFVKIIFVFYLAAVFYEKTDFKQVFLSAVIAGMHVLVLAASTDLGSALIFFVVYVLMVYVATKKVRYLLIGTAGGVAASVAAYYLFDHVKVRVLAWQDPWAYIDGKGYQITQSLFAIGSGSWFGLGLYSGTPEVIPYVEADFIFSAIAEELGVIYGILIVFICLSCFLMMIHIAVGLKDSFYRLIAFGLGIIYIFQIFLTIGGGIKFIPLTGVTLPLISYGGSSVLTTLILFFVVQGIFMSGSQEGERRVVSKKRTNGFDRKAEQTVKKES